MSIVGGSLNVNGGGGDVSQSDLDDLADVVITSPADDEVLTYDSATGNWVNAAATAAEEITFLTDGDYNETEFIFANGDVIVTAVPL